LQGSNLITCSQLKGMFLAGSYWLKIHADYVNALNVFPVPDGDTGTNMLLTMQAALAGMSEDGLSSDPDLRSDVKIDGFIDTVPEDHAGRLAAQVSQNALMGARGNSGTILSQILRGFAEALYDKAVVSVPDFAEALQAASDCAYRAVLNPVEGTILTVLKEMAHISQQLVSTVSQIDLFLSRVLEEAKRTLHTTPDLLPTLKEAGVIDSGGQGLVYLLEGMVHYVQGKPLDRLTEAKIALGPTVQGKHIRLEEINHHNHHYDVQFLIEGQNLDVDTIRDHINAMGQSPLVVGDERLIRVHVHVSDPGIPLSYGVRQGVLQDVVVENMAIQSQIFLRRQEQIDDQQTTTVISVASGPGLATIFANLGASIIINSGEMIPPTTQIFLEAIKRTQMNRVLILPNDRDIILTAQQAGHLSPKEVAVVPTATMPAGINAIISFNPAADLETNLKRMQEAARRVHTLAITQARRTTMINHIPANVGQAIALFDGQLIATAQNFEQAGLEALTILNVSEFELLTIYYGRDVSLEAVQTLSQSINIIHPHLEIEVLEGGQSNYAYIVSLE